jgi:hypothetical protein
MRPWQVFSKSAFTSTNIDDAVKAIHEFLQFQIKDHKTSDPIEVQKIVRLHPISRTLAAISALLGFC